GWRLPAGQLCPLGHGQHIVGAQRDLLARPASGVQVVVHFGAALTRTHARGQVLPAARLAAHQCAPTTRGAQRWGWAGSSLRPSMAPRVTTGCPVAFTRNGIAAALSHSICLLLN